MTTTQRIVDYYQWVLETGDPKTEDWPLVATPWPTIALVAIYLFIVKVGPKIMETRKAYSLKEVLIVYNFALVILSAYMVYEFIASVLDIPNFNWLCESVPYVRDDARQTRLARVCYVYYLSKFVEFLDTFFFILRKKNNQVTYLHVYHHASMCILWWIVLKWIPGGASYFGATCNSFVHVVMYAYYGLSAMGPHMRPYLWWKRYLTKLQLVRFLVCFPCCICVYAQVWRHYRAVVRISDPMVEALVMTVRNFLRERKETPHCLSPPRSINGYRDNMLGVTL